MYIKVIQCVETGEYLEDYYEEYPYTGWWYLTKDLSKALVFRNTFHLIGVLKCLKILDSIILLFLKNLLIFKKC